MNHNDFELSHSSLDPEQPQSEEHTPLQEAPLPPEPDSPQEASAPAGEQAASQPISSDTQPRTDVSSSNPYSANPYAAPYYNPYQGYSANPYNPYAVPPQPPKKKKHSVLKGIAIALAVCAIWGAGIAGGYFLNRYVLPDVWINDPNDVLNDNSQPNNGSPSSPIPDNQAPIFIPDDSPADTLNAKEIYANNVNSIVGISVEGETYNIFGSVTAYASSGSGFILREDGYILTNYHVVESESLDNPKLTVSLYNGDRYDAVVVGYDEYNDVALVKINASGLSPVSLGDSDQIVVGENVAIIGHPLGELTYSMSRGIVAAVNRKISVDKTTLEMFQIDAAVNAGNSGGPAFNEKGQVVGIVTAKYASSSIEGLGFCIPIKNALKIANDLLNYGFVRGQAGLGITVKAVYSGGGFYQQAYGLQVQEVNAGSCSEKAGIKKGDIIVAIGEVSVTSFDELSAAKSRYKAGDTATIKLYRNQELLEVSVTFDEFIPDALTQAPAAG